MKLKSKAGSMGSVEGEGTGDSSAAVALSEAAERHHKTASTWDAEDGEGSSWVETTTTTTETPDRCEASDGVYGSTGEVDPTTVDYRYEMSLSDGADAAEVAGGLEGAFIGELLPLFFPDGCGEEERRRRELRRRMEESAVLAISSGTEDSIIAGEKCQILDESECDAVVKGELTIWTLPGFEDQSVAETLGALEEGMKEEGGFASSHPAIEKLAWVSLTTFQAQDEGSVEVLTASGGGMNESSRLEGGLPYVVAGSALLVLSGLATMAVTFRRRRRRGAREDSDSSGGSDSDNEWDGKLIGPEYEDDQDRDTDTHDQSLEGRSFDTDDEDGFTDRGNVSVMDMILTGGHTRNEMGLDEDETDNLSLEELEYGNKHMTVTLPPAHGWH